MNAPIEPDELLTIGEMSTRTGVAPSALRYYEELELVASVRTPGNQRRYPRPLLRRVALIAVAKRRGAPRAGVAPSALRVSEELELVASVRTPGNQRRYPRHMLRRVSLIAVAKRLGVPLADVKDAFGDVPMESTPSHADWQRASRRWKKRL